MTLCVGDIVTKDGTAIGSELARKFKVKWIGYTPAYYEAGATQLVVLETVE